MGRRRRRQRPNWDGTFHLSPSRANHMNCNHYKQFFGKKSNSPDYERDYTLYTLSKDKATLHDTVKVQKQAFT